MKNLLLIILSVLFIGFMGCETDELKLENIDSEKSELRNGPIIYRACWDEWGRASKDCGGWGLCNFDDCWIWNDNYPCCGADANASNASLVVDNDNTTNSIPHKLVILLDLNSTKQVNAYNSNLALIIDQSITDSIQIPNYNTITIPADTINLDNSLGEYGGYTIPVLLN